MIAIPDVKYAARTLRRSPAFSLIAVLTVAVGIGASTAIFSMVQGVLLRRLPYGQGDRVVHLRPGLPGEGATRSGPASRPTAGDTGSR